MQAPTRSDLRAHPPVKLHSGRNITKADIYLIEHEGQKLAVKDYAARPFWIRGILGCTLVAREIRAYRRLADLPGIPKLIGRIDPFAFAVEFVSGRDLSHFRPGEVPPDFFGRLDLLVEAVHGAGVAQGDLHHRDVLVGPDWSPYLVDFSTAQFRRVNPAATASAFFRAACSADRRAVLKLKNRHHPGSLTAAESQELVNTPWWYRAGKALRRFIILRSPRERQSRH